MANNVVAYVGITNFDGIIYLSRILQKLGRKVLLADYSGTGALRNAIPQLIETDSGNSITTFRRVDFTTAEINQEVMDSYDDILIDAGSNQPCISLLSLTAIIYVTDMFEFNRKRIEEIKHFDDLLIKKSLLIKSVIDMKISVDNIILKIQGNNLWENVYVIYWDERDYANSLLCSYSKVPGFLKISAMQKAYLQREIMALLPEITRRQLNTAYNKARKGD
ncbi:MAG: hypothetical protein WBI07_19200 [Mobilitalea sp.]